MDKMLCYLVLAAALACSACGNDHAASPASEKSVTPVDAFYDVRPGQAVSDVEKRFDTPCGNQFCFFDRLKPSSIGRPSNVFITLSNGSVHGMKLTYPADSFSDAMKYLSQEFGTDYRQEYQASSYGTFVRAYEWKAHGVAARIDWNLAGSDNNKSLGNLFVLSFIESPDAVDPPNEFQGQTNDDLINAEEDLNDSCRGISGSLDDCNKRDQILQVLKGRGICWGPDDVASADKHWLTCSTKAEIKRKRRWYSQNRSSSDCIQTQSPADRIRSEHEAGIEPRAYELASGAVEIRVSNEVGDSAIWTYYPSLELCISSLPVNKPIDPRYE